MNKLQAFFAKRESVGAVIDTNRTVTERLCESMGQLEETITDYLQRNGVPRDGQFHRRKTDPAVIRLPAKRES